MQAVFLILLSLVRASPLSAPEPASMRVDGNQIVFRDRGVVVNQATFLHVRMPIRLEGVLTQGASMRKDAQLLRSTISASENSFSMEDFAKQNNLSEIFGPGYEGLMELHDLQFEDDFLMADYLYKTIDLPYSRLVGLLDVLPSQESLNDNRLSHKVFKRSVALEELKAILKVERKELALGRQIHQERQSLVRRRKRFIWGAIGTFYGIKANYKVDELVGRFNAFLRTKYAGLVDITQELGQNFTRLQMDTGLLIKINLIFASRKPHKFMAAHNFLSEQINNIFNRITDTVTSAQYQRLSPNLLSGEELKRLFEMLRSHAEKHDCNLYVYQPSDLYQVEVSHLYNPEKKIFNIFLHVPMVKQKSLLVLKEYVPFPLLQSFETNATILPEVGDTKYLAIMNDGVTDLAIRNRYRTFTEAELSVCSTLGDLFLCPGRNTLRKDLGETCIGSLIQREPSQIVKNCNMKISRKREFVARVDHNKWLVSTHEPFSTNAVCNNFRSSHPLRIGPQSEIVLPEDCEVELRDTVLSTDLNLNIEFEVKSYVCEDLGNVFSNFYQNKSRLAEVIQDTLSLRGSFFSGDLQHLKQAEIVLSEFPDPFSELFGGIAGFFGAIASTLITGLVIVVGVFLTCCLMRVGCCSFCCKSIRNCCDVFKKDEKENAPSRPRSNSVSGENKEGETIVERIIIREEPKTVSFAVEEPREPPPPYNSFAFMPSAPTPRLSRSNLKPASSMISIASGFRTPGFCRSMEDLSCKRESSAMEFASAPAWDSDIDDSMRPCKVGPISRRGIRPSEFICAEHHPDTGCVGYFPNMQK